MTVSGSGTRFTATRIFTAGLLLGGRGRLHSAAWPSQGARVPVRVSPRSAGRSCGIRQRGRMLSSALRVATLRTRPSASRAPARICQSGSARSATRAAPQVRMLGWSRARGSSPGGARRCRRGRGRRAAHTAAAAAGRGPGDIEGPRDTPSGTRFASSTASASAPSPSIRTSATSQEHPRPVRSPRAFSMKGAAGRGARRPRPARRRATPRRSPRRAPPGISPSPDSEGEMRARRIARGSRHSAPRPPPGGASTRARRGRPNRRRRRGRRRALQTRARGVEGVPSVGKQVGMGALEGGDGRPHRAWLADRLHSACSRSGREARIVPRLPPGTRAARCAAW